LTQPEVVDSRNVWAIDVEGGGEPRVVLGDPFDVFHARLSPDNPWLSYTSCESGQAEV
jgi:hypothetical protein